MRRKIQSLNFPAALMVAEHIGRRRQKMRRIRRGKMRPHRTARTAGKSVKVPPRSEPEITIKLDFLEISRDAYISAG